MAQRAFQMILQYVEALVLLFLFEPRPVRCGDRGVAPGRRPEG